MSDLIGLTVREMRHGLLAGDFSAVELTNAHIERINSTNATLNSFITITADSAIEQAKATDRQLKEHGDKTPILTGIPVAIKDMLCTKGIETTCASKILKGFVPPYDCTAVAKLKDSGAVILGKTNLDEFAMGSSTENSAFGNVKNPWDLERIPGGSSGGSAVAVAVGQAPISLGTDTGGSIRQPASMCGVYGIKPTYGRVSRHGAVAFASSLDQIGPFARSVEDLAVALQAISGEDSNDSTCMSVPVPDYLKELRETTGKGLKGIRVGVPKQYFIDGIEPEVLASVKAGLQGLAKLGAELVEISLPHTEHALAVYYVLAPAEAASNLARYDGIRYGYRAKDAHNLTETYQKSRAQGFGAEVKRRIMIGSYVLSSGYYDAYYRKAQEVRTLIINDFRAAYNNDCDVIVAPVSPVTAFKIGERTDDPLQMYLADVFTIPVSLAGLPGASVPCGLDSKGLPIGLQIVGAPFKESTVLQVANEFSRENCFDGSKVIKTSY